jgi:hypothetical protein
MSLYMCIYVAPMFKPQGQGIGGYISGMATETPQLSGHGLIAQVNAVPIPTKQGCPLSLGGRGCSLDVGVLVDK